MANSYIPIPALAAAKQYVIPDWMELPSNVVRGSEVTQWPSGNQFIWSGAAWFPLQVPAPQPDVPYLIEIIDALKAILLQLQMMK